MANWGKAERAAAEAVAGRFLAAWKDDGDPGEARLFVAGKQIALDLATVKRCGGRQAYPRLRFDKVATRLVKHLQAAARKTVPDKTTVLVTITAPIRLPAKTATALEDKLQAVLKRGAPRDQKTTIAGNRVRIRLLRSRSARAPKLIGFVHNPGPDPRLLFDITRELLELTAKARKRVLRDARWLVLSSAGGIACLEPCRYIISELRETTDCKKILMVFGDGRVEELLE